MALDATVAGASADAYLTVADADAIAAADMGSEAERWLSSSTTVTQREIALKRATREIDDLPHSGTAYSTTQALVYPLSDDLDVNGDPIIVKRVRHATYYQAAFVLSNAAVIDRANARRARDVSQASEPDMSYTLGEGGRSIYSPRALQSLEGNARGGGMVAVWATTGLEDPYTEAVVL